ncbi:hypothetical protein CLIM01_14473 [Colletotrichum limetticola]|uniref:Uncharacterized protein n=1 Tax=Colletotrichum limetticola TaxID=1209924 RepID=A0ABQ9P7S3_9PEZI|nr:hypothetical protein CLIM01_14473 [Colletotrichum limetticola]
METSKQSGLFDNEASIYHQLQPLQGIIIPKYLGLASIEGKRAHLLSDIGGMAMIKEEMPRFERATLQNMISLPIRLIREHGVRLEDLSMYNVHLCGEAFRIVDLAHARIVTPEATGADAEDHDQVQDLVERFQSRQDALISLAKPVKRRRRGRLGNRPTATGRISKPLRE